MELTHSIFTFTEFHNLISNYKHNYIFRGEQDSTYSKPLTPKIARKANHISSEYDIYKEFSRLATPYHKVDIVIQPFETLSIGQHYGLPTRLLDWSKNPLIAAFFSIGSLDNPIDGAVYILNIDTFPTANNLTIDDKYDIIHNNTIKEDIMIYYPNHNSKRIIAQNALFTYHHTQKGMNFINYIEYNNKHVKIDTDSEHSRFQEIELKKIIIKKEFKQELFDTLNLFGYTYASIFPDLDGICNYINQKYSKGEL